MNKTIISTRKKFRFSIRLLLVVTGALLGVFSIYSWLSYRADCLADGHAQWAVGVAIANYLDETQEWPRDWTVLEPQLKHVGGVWNFQQYQRRIFVDFSRDISELQALSQSSKFPTLIRPRFTFGNFPKGDANILVWEYFQSRSSSKGHELQQPFR